MERTPHWTVAMMRAMLLQSPNGFNNEADHYRHDAQTGQCASLSGNIAPHISPFLDRDSAYHI